MTTDLILVLALLGISIAMFAINRPRADAVALIAMAALPFTGVVPIEEAIAGFANPNIVLIAAMFVIGEGLARTGVAQRLGDWLVTRGGESPTRQLVLLMLAVGLLGSVMSSTGAVAMFIPVVMRIASRTRTAPAQLMMPMAYAALISGMMTLVATSPNLVINYELIGEGVDGFGFFAFTPFGIPVLLAGIAYMLYARRWLPADTADDALSPSRPKMKKWVKRYSLAEREYRVRVRPGSSLIDLPLGEINRIEATGARLILVERGSGRNRRLLPRSPELVLQADDVLLLDFDHPLADARILCERFNVDMLPSSGRYFIDRFRDVGMVEVVLPEESRFARKTVVEVEALVHADLSIIGVRRGKAARQPHHLRQTLLKVGDTLLLAGPWRVIRALQDDGRDLLVLNLPREFGEILPASGKAPWAILTLGVVVALMATGVLPNVHAALIGCLMMGLFGCISLDQAYRSIQLKTLVMIVGMLPFATALERTGGMDMAAAFLVGLVGGAGIHVVLAVVFALTTLCGLFVSNTANAVLLAPLAIAMAQALGLSPYPFAMTVALACSAPFMTPLSPVNALVATAGNYGFRDFFRVGAPLTLIVMVICVVMVPWLLPP